MNKGIKKQKINLLLKQINSSEDPTAINCTFIILDFDKSGNNVIVDKEVALEGGKTLINKPIVAFYSPPTEPNTMTDNFGDHEQYLGENRYGDMVIKSNTVPIGVFTTEGYVLNINIEGEEKEVLAADAVLWNSRFPDACDLIQEWYSRGVSVVTSCEYLYSNYEFKDGVEYHYSPIYFEGHAVLASEDRGDKKAVLPAYETSQLLSINEIQKFNKLVAQALNQHNEEKESETMPTEMFKKVCELSHNDVRSLIYNQLDPKLGENEYSYIADVYEAYFIVNLYSFAEDNEYDKYFKVNYTKNDNSVTIDLESKVEVFMQRNWEEVIPEEVQSQLNEKETTIEELTSQVNSLKEEKESVQKQFNDVSEKITQLNSVVEELKPYKEQVDKETYEKALNEKQELYKGKFQAVNALEKFDEEDVQELIKKSLNSNDEGKDAIYQLNSMLVDLVQLQTSTSEEEPLIKEVNSKRKDLIPADDDFESRYAE